MPGYELNLWDYWRIVYKRKWVIVSIFAAAVASSYFFVEKAEPLYRSTVILHMDTGRTPIAEITGAGVTFWGGGGTDVPTQLELIKSYSILKDVAIRLGEITENSDNETVQAVLRRLKSKITVAEQPDTSLVEISAIDGNPVEAKRIAGTVAKTFIDKNWKDKLKEARNTKDFVEEQLKKMDRTIADIRKKLKTQGVVPSGGGEMTSGETDLRARLAQLELDLRNLRTRYTDNYPGIINVTSEIKNIKDQLGKNFSEERPSGLEAEVIDTGKLESDLAINQKLYGLLRERYEKARILEASKTRDIEIVNPAVVPAMPIAGPATANILLASAVGLILGLVAAFIVETLDTSIGTIEDVEEYLKIPVLGVIPRIEIDKKEEADYWKKPPPPAEKKEYIEIMKRLVSQFKPQSAVAEAYRNLQTYIKFSGLDKTGNALGITSASMQEGKTITAVNSAISLAQMGYRVLLVDADLRKPSVHKVFGIKKESGLTEAVLGTLKLEEAIKTVDDVMLGNIKSSMIMKTYGLENLNIITSGHLPMNPTEILGSQSMSEFVEKVKSKFQVVLFDTAPILPVTDSCILSSKIDGVIIVYKVGHVSRGALKRCKMQLENAKGNPIGVVLNNMRVSDMKFGSPFSYYYQKYYGESDKEKEVPVARK